MPVRDGCAHVAGGRVTGLDIRARSTLQGLVSVSRVRPSKTQCDVDRLPGMPKPVGRGLESRHDPRGESGSGVVPPGQQAIGSKRIPAQEPCGALGQAAAGRPAVQGCGTAPRAAALGGAPRKIGRAGEAGACCPDGARVRP